MSTENVFGGNITAQDIDCDNVTVTATIDVDSLQVATAIVTPQITAFFATTPGQNGNDFTNGATAGVAGATGGAGGAVISSAGNGGNGTAGNGGNGGGYDINGGAGAQGTLGGIGGAITADAGNGGNGTAGNGGTGGLARLVAGAGGNAPVGAFTGGAGGTAQLTAGTGGGSGVANVGGAGGNVTVTAGAGGTGLTTGGVGGNVTITAGNAGAAGNIAGGNITLAPGTANGTGTPGIVIATGLQTKSASSTAIVNARGLTLQDSGGAFTVSQAAVYDINLPSPTVGAGLRYIFFLNSAAANTVSIKVSGGAATFIGTILSDTNVIPCTGSSINYVTGTAVVGDCIEVYSVAANLYAVRAVTSAAGGITIT